MEANELMIGDWVNYRGICNRIAPADFCHFEWIDEIRPIPLTPEILEKNGFTKSTPPSGIHAICYNLDNKEEKYHLTIANYNKYKRLLLNVDSEDSECFNIKCDYIHQLQHALGLCKIKKEIVL